MAKALTAKNMQDEDGRIYTFDRIAFNKAITKEAKKRKASLISVQREIGDACAVSEDAVRKWKKGDNGIGSIDTAKAAASVLNVDYHDLLTPVKKQESAKMSVEEKNVILKVFGDCVSTVYCMEEKSRQHYDRPGERWDDMETSFEIILRETHLYIDQNVLLISDQTRYSLHRILKEYDGFLEDHDLPIRWDKIVPEQYFSIPEGEYLFDGDNREYYLSDTGDFCHCRPYLCDELELASNLGLDDECVEPTEEQWDALEDAEDMCKFGYLPGSAKSLTPGIVAIDLFVTEMKKVFEHDFPGAFEN